MILKKRILRQEQCLSHSQGQGRTLLRVTSQEGSGRPGTLPGLSLGGVGRVTPRQDPPVVPLLRELLLLGTSGHICRANLGTSILSEVQK